MIREPTSSSGGRDSVASCAIAGISTAGRQPGRNGKKPVRVGGKTFYVQNAAFLTWTKESTLPADGDLHFCTAAYLMISPQGVPHTPSGLYEGYGDQPLQDINVFTGHATNWPSGVEGPMVHFTFHGRFNLKKHRIKITGKCDGVTATRTYKLTKRF